MAKSYLAKTQYKKMAAGGVAMAAAISERKWHRKWRENEAMAASVKKYQRHQAALAKAGGGAAS